jgi:glycosyltransferase involved in cell wall biosynthesis
MTDNTNLLPSRLYTIWSTVLFVDEETGELRHGPIDSGPDNTLFVPETELVGRFGRGAIVHRRADGTEMPVTCRSDRCVTIDRPESEDVAVGTKLEIVPLERGLIGLTAGGHFLCAMPNGTLHFQNTWCSSWECFLASEDWCGRPPISHAEAAALPLNRRQIAKIIIDARLRAKANFNSKATKILIYGYPAWSHGRVYYDVCKHLYERGYIVDIINWQMDHAAYIGELNAYYDLFISALDGLRTLLEIYGIPPEKVIGLSHHEMDMQVLIEQMGKDVFNRLAGFAVVSYQLFDASMIFGVPREPLVVQLGVNCDEFAAPIPERLQTVGYAGSYSHKTRDGLEWKRGEIAEAAVREAGLEFKVAGWTGEQIPFHDMPDFYRSVDAIVVSSVSEGAQLPIREGAAAGRLVISTPVGDFPLRASQGLGVIAPIEGHKYQQFVTALLRHYKQDRAAFLKQCGQTQEAARQIDWKNLITDWIELIEEAQKNNVTAVNYTGNATLWLHGSGKAIRSYLISRVWRGSDPVLQVCPNLYEYDLQGWNSEHRYLAESIAELKPASVLEVGVWKGGSTIFMANEIKRLCINSVVIAVDTWLGSSEHWLTSDFSQISFLSGYPALYHKFISNVVRSNVGEYILPMPMDSLNAAKVLKCLGARLTVIHLDGGHDYESVAADLRAWWPLLADGGVLIGDDYFANGLWPDVKRAFDDFFEGLNINSIENADGKCRIYKVPLQLKDCRQDPKSPSVLSKLELRQRYSALARAARREQTQLCRIMTSFGSDKGSPFHNYTIIYDWLFSDFRHCELMVFELGLGTNKIGAPSSMGAAGCPGASLRGWREYFPNAHIFGADIDRDILFDEERIRTFWTDQRDPRAIRRMCSDIGETTFDVIIDDGLHEAPPNIAFFLGSIDLLKPGGIYVIEDIGKQDVDRMSSFASCVMPAARDIIFDEIEHEANLWDNRLFIFQKR